MGWLRRLIKKDNYGFGNGLGDGHRSSSGSSGFKMPRVRNPETYRYRPSMAGTGSTDMGMHLTGDRNARRRAAYAQAKEDASFAVDQAHYDAFAGDRDAALESFRHDQDAEIAASRRAQDQGFAQEDAEQDAELSLLQAQASGIEDPDQRAIMLELVSGLRDDARQGRAQRAQDLAAVRAEEDRALDRQRAEEDQDNRDEDAKWMANREGPCPVLYKHDYVTWGPRGGGGTLPLPIGLKGLVVSDPEDMVPEGNQQIVTVKWNRGGALLQANSRDLHKLGHVHNSLK